MDVDNLCRNVTEIFSNFDTTLVFFLLSFTDIDIQNLRIK